MTLPQILSIATLAGMMALFVWGRFRYDVVAVIALLVSMALGLVGPDKAFTGFSDELVIIVGSALVLSAAVQRSGVIETALAFVSKRVKRVRSQLVVLTATVGFTSARWGSLASFGTRTPPGQKKMYGVSGNSFVAVVEFGDQIRARAVSAGGQSGDPSSKHFNDQASRYAAGNRRDPHEAYIAFRGRPPNVEGLLKKRGLAA